MSVISIQQLTPDDRLWRIDWFGEIAYPSIERRSQPSIRVAISPVLCDPEDSSALLSPTATDLRVQKQVWIPVGMLPLVKIGDIWQNGQCLHTPSYQTGIFNNLEIKKGTTDFIKAGLSIEDKFLLSLNDHPWHRLQTHSYCLSVILPEMKRIIIPCVELIRFYFGSSSNFIHLLFTKIISEDMFWRSKSFDELYGRLHMKLAANISGLSATDIGRMALDPIAWRAAHRIFNSCQAASLNHETIYPRAEFPFNGETDLVATGKWISGGNSDSATFVVYSLQSCSYPFPFTSLSYEVADRKKIGAKSNSTNQLQKDQESTSIGIGVTAKSQTLSNTDPGTSKSSKEHWIKGNPRFPDLTKKLVWRERYDTSDPPAVLMLKSSVQNEQVSVGDGSSSNGKTRGIDIGQGHIHTDLSEIDSKNHKFVHEGIKIAVRQAKLHDQTTTTELITLPGYTHPVISLPHLVDEAGEIHPVSFCSDGHGGQRMRRGCFAEISESANTNCRVFIVERENSVNPVMAINLTNIDLMRAMEKLIEERNRTFVNAPPPISPNDF